MGSKEKIYELIDNIRLPMIIGIVFCHTHFFKYLTPEELSTSLSVNFPVLNTVIYICYWLIGKIFTPTFFFLSGYLFFREHTLNRKVYAGKIKRRFYSLLIPYLIWNAVMLMVMYLQERFMGGTSERMGRIADYGWSDYLYAFWDCTHSWSFTDTVGQPANIPLWFLRDLMILSVCSPLFYYVSKLRKPIGIILLCLIYICPFHLPHLQNLSVFWFGLGVWTQMNDIDFVSFSEKSVKWCIPLFILFSVIHEVLAQKSVELPVDAVVPAMRMAEFPILISTVSYILKKTSKRIPGKISKSSFFIYLSHIVPTAMLCSLTCKLLPHADGLLTIAYLVIPFVVTLLLILVYILLERFLPRTMKVLTGSR